MQSSFQRCLGFAASCDRSTSLAPPRADLGRSWETPRIAFKPYPYAAAVVEDAVLSLEEVRAIRPGSGVLRTELVGAPG